MAVAEWKYREQTNIMDDSVHYYTEIHGTTIQSLDFPYEDITASLSYACSKEYAVRGVDGVSAGGPRCRIELHFNKKINHSSNNNSATIRLDKEKPKRLVVSTTHWKHSLSLHGYMDETSDLSDIDGWISNLQRKLFSRKYKSLMVRVPWSINDYGIFTFDISGMREAVQGLRKELGYPPLEARTCSAELSSWSLKVKKRQKIKLCPV